MAEEPTALDVLEAEDKRLSELFESCIALRDAAQEIVRWINDRKAENTREQTSILRAQQK